MVVYLSSQVRFSNCEEALFRPVPYNTLTTPLSLLSDFVPDLLSKKLFRYFLIVWLF